MSDETHKIDVLIGAKDEASPVLNRLSTVGAMGFGALAKIGANAVSTLTGGISGFARSTISLGQNFTSAMSEVSAISGATGSDLQTLETTARQMGATTIFSASEAAEGLKYMAMAGWDTQQMVSGLPAVLNLAAASGEDLGKTSDIVTDALTAFGLQATDATHFTDVLAQTSNRANTNVSMLGESFKYVAPVAGAMGYSVEDTSVALGLMANAGIKASSAGTQLRTIISNMANPTDAMAGAMDQLGISLTDSSGNMKSFGQITDDLRSAFSGLSEEQKAQYAATLAGKEGMSGLLAIVNASEGDINKLRDAMANCDGAAEKMAATMNDNLKGDLAQLNSAWEELQLKLYTAVEPALRTIVQAITANVIPAITALIDFIQGMHLDEAFANIDLKPILGIVAAVGGAILAIKGFGFLKSFNPFSAFGKRGKSTFAQLGAGLGNFLSKTVEGTGKAVKAVEVGFGQMSSNMMKGFGAMTKTIGSMPLTGVLAFAGVVAVLTAAFIALAACKDIVLPFLEGLGNILVGVLNGALQAVANMLVTLSPIITTVAQAFAMLAPLVTAFGTAISAVVTAIGGAVSSIITAVVPIVEIIGHVFTSCVSIVANAIVAIVQALAPVAPELTKMVHAVSEAVQSIAAAFSDLVGQIAPIIDSISNLLDTLGNKISQIFDSAAGVIESFGDMVNNILSGISGVIESIGNAALNAGKGFEALARGVEKITSLNLFDMGASLAAVATGIAAIATASLGLGDAGTQMQALGTGLVLIQSAATGAIAAMANFGSIVTQLQQVGACAPQVTMAATAITQFAASAVSAMAGLMGAMVGLSAFTAGLTQLSSSATSASAGAMVMASAFAGVSSSASSAAVVLAALASTANSTASVFASMSSIVLSGMMGMAAGVRSGMSAVASAITSGMRTATRAVTSGVSSMLMAMTSGVSAMSSAGRAMGVGASNGLRSGVSPMPAIARSACSSAVAAMSGYYGAAYSAGAYIGMGLANGMASQLGRVQSIAASLANAAARATAAAAKVHSPSRVFMELGQYIGKGFEIGMEKTHRMVEKAAESLVSIPEVSNTSFAMADGINFAGMPEPDGEVIIEVHQEMDGREWAKSTARFTRKELESHDKLIALLKGEK